MQHYLVLKDKFPQNSSSKSPTTDKAHLHPCIYGSDNGNLSQLDWDKLLPGFLPLATEVVQSVSTVMHSARDGESTAIIYPNIQRAEADGKVVCRYEAYEIACRSTEQRLKEYCKDTISQGSNKGCKQMIRKDGPRGWVVKTDSNSDLEDDESETNEQWETNNDLEDDSDMEEQLAPTKNRRTKKSCDQQPVRKKNRRIDCDDNEPQSAGEVSDSDSDYNEPPRKKKRCGNQTTKPKRKSARSKKPRSTNQEG